MKKNKDLAIHLIMCGMGGFLGGYALMLRGCFGSASTGNMLSAVCDLALRDPQRFGLRLIGFFLFGTPFMISRFIEVRTKLNKRYFCLAVEILGLILVALLPVETDPVIAVFPLFVASAFQWSAFGGTKEYPCSTIFISNNTRQCFTAFADYLLSRDKKMLARFHFFGASILSYLIFGFVSAGLALWKGPYASLFGIVLPLSAAALLHLSVGDSH